MNASAATPPVVRPRLQRSFPNLVPTRKRPAWPRRSEPCVCIWSPVVCHDLHPSRANGTTRCHVLHARVNASTHPLRHVHGAVQDAKAEAILASHRDTFVGSDLHSKLSHVYPYLGASPAGIPQGSDAWLQARSKRVTASTVAKAAGLLPAYVPSIRCYLHNWHLLLQFATIPMQANQTAHKSSVMLKRIGT